MSSGPQTGDILAGKYQVERVLGVGGMGIVVSAHHLQLDQKVAIKYLLPDAMQNVEVVERFGREARAAAKIRGEHVARVIDVGKFDDGSPFMVMEYLEGHDLSKQLEEYGPLRVEDAIRYLLETCEALAEAHAAKIVHRDLKPSNLFLAKQPDKRSIVKVLDFGISKIEGAAVSANLTKTSAFMGTAYYMSPEQMMSARLVDARSDIWALGVILYELLAGRAPFRGETVPEVVAAILSNNPEPLRQIRPDLPLGLDAVVMSCLRTKQDERPSSVAVLAEALSPFALPQDRTSAEIARRVLGEPAGLESQPTIMTPSARAERGSVPEFAEAAARPPGGGLTQQGLAASVASAPKKSPLPMIGVGLALLLGLVGGAIAFTRGPSSSSANPGPAATMTTVVEAPAALMRAPPSTLAPLPEAPPLAAPPVDPAQAAPQAGANVRGKTDKPSSRTKPTPAASARIAAPTPPTAPPTAPPPSAPATPTAPPNSNTTKNPMQMGIK